MIGVKSLTHSALQAHLPRLFTQVLSKKKHFTRFNGFTSFGRSVKDNLIPLVNGASVSTWEDQCKDAPALLLVKEPWRCDLTSLLQYFSKLNYETFYGEEMEDRQLLHRTRVKLESLLEMFIPGGPGIFPFTEQ